MSIYDPLSLALGIESCGILPSLDQLRDEHLIENPDGDIIEPWNKGRAGYQKNPFKGVKNRYTKEQLKLTSHSTKKAMAKISDERKKEYYSQRDSCNGRIWIHNKKGNHKRILRSEMSIYISEGWSQGRLLKHDPKNGQFIS